MRPPNPFNGAPENTGDPVASIIKSLGAPKQSMGMATGQSKGRVRGTEKPSLARSSAIIRRLNGNPSKGTELKGL